jgi:chemotaxis response regulator CheB
MLVVDPALWPNSAQAVFVRMRNSVMASLVDDHSRVRRAFRRLLEDERDLVVVGEASDGPEAVERTRQLRPEVVVMDFIIAEH